MMRLGTTLALLACTAAYVVLNPPANLALGQGVLRAVPAAFGDWNGSELSFEDAVIEELAADDVLIRKYVRGDELVWLCVVYHQNRRYGAHDPLLCYESQGYGVEAKGETRLDDGSATGLVARTFVATRPRDRRAVIYWWTTDGLSTGDEHAFRARMALTGALQNRSWGAFVRVESVVPKGDLEGTERRVAEFASRVARELPAVLSAARAAPSTVEGGR